MTNKPCPVCGKEPTATPIENSFYSYAELTEEQKIRFAAYQVFDMPKKASSKLEAAQRWIPVSEPPKIDGTYLLRNIYEDVYSCDFIADTNTWVLSEYDSITHWMPLPSAPESEDER